MRLLTWLLVGCVDPPNGDDATDTEWPTDTSDADTDADSDADSDSDADTDTDTDCVPEAEVCNGVDDDCDTLTDDDDPDVSSPSWYRDGDGDGYGDPADASAACTAPPAYVADDTDCDDALAEIHPGAVEACDRVDADCDGLVSDAVDPCVESFEGIGDGNLPTPYTFASGVRMIEPNPNPSDSFGVIVVECGDGGGFFGFDCALGVPRGTAALGNANLGLFHAWRFRFPEPASEVSLQFASSDSNPDTVFALQAYDAGGVVVASDSGSGPVAIWDLNLLSVSAPGITEVVVTSDGSGSLLADGLSWR